MNIRYPNINGQTPAQQLTQIRGFLYQLVQQLNVEGGGQEIATSPSAPRNDRGDLGSLGQVEAGQTTATPGSTFNSIKSLIIKSAEIVDAYYTEINRRLESVYVAESDFGTYQRQASQEITANADRIEQVFTSVQSIEGQLEKTIATSANINSGLLFTVGEENLEPELGQTLDEGVEVHGVEIGTVVKETDKETGEVVETFNKFARFTAYGMTLYDSNGKLTAWFTDKGMNIPNAVIKNSLIRGGFEETINADGSSVERWVGA